MNFNILIEKGEDGYLISEVVELPGCHTQAKDMNELIRRTKEAIELYLEEQKDVVIQDNFIGVQKIEVQGNEVAPINC
ncbi:MAG: type II toxin-antitoxin system HicB family antitoxin [Nanoarchaeota archaeon]